MIFSKLFKSQTYRLINNGKHNSLLISHVKHSVAYNRNYSSSSTQETHNSRENDSSNKNDWNLKAVALVVASTTLLGLFKLIKESQENHFKDVLDNMRPLFSPNNLQAKEESSEKKHLVITPRQKLFFQFASVEYEGLPYMTPQDFLESVTEDHPRPRVRRKLLTKEMVDKYLNKTPGHGSGSNRFFRNLEEKGLISYSEYLFLLCVITKPKSNFRIAFNMFDTDGNKKVDKSEFLVVTQIFQRDSEPKKTKAPETNEQKNFEEKFIDSKNKLIQSMKAINNQNVTDTTLLVHFFGPRGRKQLEFSDFQKFSNDLQREVLEIEFNEFSKGMNKISSIEFAEILLRYTKFSQEKKNDILERLNKDEDSFIRGISFDKFYQFSMFMNNLDDFSLALKFHTQANRSISTNEFQRAVKISSGFTLDEQIVQVIFKVFDENSDGQLSYKEFIAVLKGRLRRGLTSGGQASFALNNHTNANDLTQSDLLRTNDQAESIMTTFKNCIRRKLRENNYE